MSSTNTPKIATIDDLLKRIDTGYKLKKVVVYVEELNNNIVLQEPTRQMFMDLDSIEDGEQSDLHFLSQCIIEPRLNTPELLKSAGVPDVIELLKKLLKHSTRQSLAKAAISLSGYDGSGVRVIEQIKN